MDSRVAVADAAMTTTTTSFVQRPAGSSLDTLHCYFALAFVPAAAYSTWIHFCVSHLAQSFARDSVVYVFDQVYWQTMSTLMTMWKRTSWNCCLVDALTMFVQQHADAVTCAPCLDLCVRSWRHRANWAAAVDCPAQLLCCCYCCATLNSTIRYWIAGCLGSRRDHRCPVVVEALLDVRHVRFDVDCCCWNYADLPMMPMTTFDASHVTMYVSGALSSLDRLNFF